MLTDTADDNEIDFFDRCEFEDHAAEVWEAFGPSVLVDWPAGTRPSLWWRFDAPRLRQPPPRWPQSLVQALLADMIEPRQKIAGTGIPAHESLPLKPRYRLGIIVDWVDIDDADPPTFETQHSYLERFNLLADGEAPAQLEPLVVVRAVPADHPAMIDYLGRKK